jgi:hypothetical protein
VTEAATQARDVPGLGVALGAAIVVAGLLNTAGVFSEDAIHWKNWALGFAFVAIAAAVVFGLFVRRARVNPNRAWITGLVFAVLGVLTVVAFWSGLPPVFGTAGMYLGIVSFRLGTTTTANRAGAVVAVIGAAALVIDVFMFATDIATRV